MGSFHRNDNKLDNPVWFSLSESHKEFAVDYTNIKFYQPDYCPFGGFLDADGISDQIDKYSKLVDSFFVVGEKPTLSNQLKIEREVVCLQMIINSKIDIEIKEPITELTAEHADDLYRLVNLVQPGYFKKKTALLGSYFGIYKDGKLVAVSGERMKMNDFVEVSAVVTHPSHTGKGYAKQLVAHTVNNLIAQGKVPYLHVVEDNAGAINLYIALGFEVRRKISFWNIVGIIINTLNM